jgi:hypothetical protein
MRTIYDFYYENKIRPTGGRIGVIMLTMYASLNSLLTLFFVTPYRRYTLERLRILVQFLRKPFCGPIGTLFVEPDRRTGEELRQ